MSSASCYTQLHNIQPDIAGIFRNCGVFHSIENQALFNYAAWVCTVTFNSAQWNYQL